MTPLQEATQFFYEQVGHRIIESAPAPSYAVATEGECALCGRHGAGFFDERGHHAVFRCTACWSFYWPSDRVFPRTGPHQRDFSFAGIVKNTWVVDASGMCHSPTGSGTNKNGDFIAAAARYGFDFTGQERPENWLFRKVFSGDLRFPLLWANFGQNKIKSIQALRLSHGPQALVRATGGEVIWYDGSRITQATQAVCAMDDETYARLDATQWLFSGLPESDLDRIRVRRTLRELGMPKRVMDLSSSSLDAVRQLARRERPAKPKKGHKTAPGQTETEQPVAA